jgi:ABC-type lipoprotein export system ATPase subunit|tara:strand:- start:1035 stop:1676 length:642 start_codon:yes stop_codon:yes gene_type:complete
LNWTFKHIIPLPLLNEGIKDSAVWNKEISFEENSNYNIISPSGKGKSTLVSFCNGFRQDFKGELLLNNQSIVNVDSNKWALIRAQKLAYIPQDLLLIPYLTIWENLILKNKLTNHKKDSEILQLIEAFGLEKCKDKNINLISIGQQQRVAIIRALIQPFETLIMDEPFSHIDNSNINIASELIETACKKENANFIITSLNNKSTFENVQQICL